MVRASWVDKPSQWTDNGKSCYLWQLAVWQIDDEIHDYAKSKVSQMLDSGEGDINGKAHNYLENTSKTPAIMSPSPSVCQPKGRGGAGRIYSLTPSSSLVLHV